MNKPIVLPESEIPLTSVLTSEEEQEKIEQQQKDWNRECAIFATHEAFKKLELLFDYYGFSMKKNEWTRFAMILAFDNLPGFKLKYRKKAGAPKDWQPMKLVILNWEVNKILEEKRKLNKRATISSACKVLESKFGVSAKTLMTRYSESKKSAVVKYFEKKRLDLKNNSASGSDDSVDSLLSIIDKAMTKKVSRIK